MAGFKILFEKKLAKILLLGQTVGMNYKSLDDHKQTEEKNRSDCPAPRVLSSPALIISNYIIKLSLLSFVFFAPISISGEQISLGLGFLGWVGYFFSTPKDNRAQILITPIGKAFFIFALAALISVIFSEEKLAALNSFRSLWVIFAFFLGVNWIKSQKYLNLCIILLIITASVPSIIGIFQHLGGLKIWGYQFIDYKWGATGFHHGSGSMTFAGVIMLVLLVGIPFLLVKKLEFQKIWLVIPLIFLIIAFLLSWERGAWLGFLGGIVFWGAFQGKRALFLLIFIFSVGAGITNKLNPDIWVRAASIFNIEITPSNSAGQRILIWNLSLQVFKDHPLTGSGFNQFEKYADAIIQPKTKVSSIQITTCHAHSNLLQILATTGILGLIAFLYLWIIVFLELFRNLRVASPNLYPYYLGVLCALVGFHIEGFFEYTFGDAEIITLIWFLLGGAIALGKSEETKSISSQPQAAIT